MMLAKRSPFFEEKMKNRKNLDTLTDYVSGREVFDIGAEANRQAVERYLVNEKGFAKSEIEVDVDLELIIADKPYRSHIDLVVSVDEVCYMAIKCAAGSLASREREILAAARLLMHYQIPVAAVSDGKTAIVLDTLSGKKTGEGLEAVPNRRDARNQLKEITLQPLPANRREGEKLIFRTYDMMNVNVRRNISSI